MADEQEGLAWLKSLVDQVPPDYRGTSRARARDFLKELASQPAGKIPGVDWDVGPVHSRDEWIRPNLRNLRGQDPGAADIVGQMLSPGYDFAIGAAEQRAGQARETAAHAQDMMARIEPISRALRDPLSALSAGYLSLDPMKMGGARVLSAVMGRPGRGYDDMQADYEQAFSDTLVNRAVEIANERGIPEDQFQEWVQQKLGAWNEALEEGSVPAETGLKLSNQIIPGAAGLLQAIPAFRVAGGVAYLGARAIGAVAKKALPKVVTGGVAAAASQYPRAAAITQHVGLGAAGFGTYEALRASLPGDDGRLERFLHGSAMGAVASGIGVGAKITGIPQIVSSVPATGAALTLMSGQTEPEDVIVGALTFMAAHGVQGGKIPNQQKLQELERTVHEARRQADLQDATRQARRARGAPEEEGVASVARVAREEMADVEATVRLEQLLEMPRSRRPARREAEYGGTGARRRRAQLAEIVAERGPREREETRTLDRMQQTEHALRLLEEALTDPEPGFRKMDRVAAEMQVDRVALDRWLSDYNLGREEIARIREERTAKAGKRQLMNYAEHLARTPERDRTPIDPVEIEQSHDAPGPRTVTPVRPPPQRKVQEEGDQLDRVRNPSRYMSETRLQDLREKYHAWARITETLDQFEGEPDSPQLQAAKREQTTLRAQLDATVKLVYGGQDLVALMSEAQSSEFRGSDPFKAILTARPLRSQKEAALSLSLEEDIANPNLDRYLRGFLERNPEGPDGLVERYTAGIENVEIRLEVQRRVLEASYHPFRTFDPAKKDKQGKVIGEEGLDAYVKTRLRREVEKNYSSLRAETERGDRAAVERIMTGEEVNPQERRDIVSLAQELRDNAKREGGKVPEEPGEAAETVDGGLRGRLEKLNAPSSVLELLEDSVSVTAPGRSVALWLKLVGEARSLEQWPDVFQLVRERLIPENLRPGGALAVPPEKVTARHWAMQVFERRLAEAVYFPDKKPGWERQRAFQKEFPSEQRPGRTYTEIAKFQYEAEHGPGSWDGIKRARDVEMRRELEEAFGPEDPQIQKQIDHAANKEWNLLAQRVNRRVKPIVDELLESWNQLDLLQGLGVAEGKGEGAVEWLKRHGGLALGTVAGVGLGLMAQKLGMGELGHPDLVAGTGLVLGSLKDWGSTLTSGFRMDPGQRRQLEINAQGGSYRFWKNIWRDYGFMDPRTERPLKELKDMGRLQDFLYDTIRPIDAHVGGRSFITDAEMAPIVAAGQAEVVSLKLYGTKDFRYKKSKRGVVTDVVRWAKEGNHAPEELVVDALDGFRRTAGQDTPLSGQAWLTEYKAREQKLPQLQRNAVRRTVNELRKMFDAEWVAQMEARGKDPTTTPGIHQYIKHLFPGETREQISDRAPYLVDLADLNPHTPSSMRHRAGAEELRGKGYSTDLDLIMRSYWHGMIRHRHNKQLFREWDPVINGQQTSLKDRFLEPQTKGRPKLAKGAHKDIAGLLEDYTAANVRNGGVPDKVLPRFPFEAIRDKQKPGKGSWMSVVLAEKWDPRPTKDASGKLVWPKIKLLRRGDASNPNAVPLEVSPHQFAAYGKVMMDGLKQMGQVRRAKHMENALLFTMGRGGRPGSWGRKGKELEKAYPELAKGLNWLLQLSTHRLIGDFNPRPLTNNLIGGQVLVGLHFGPHFHGKGIDFARRVLSGDKEAIRILKKANVVASGAGFFSEFGEDASTVRQMQNWVTRGSGIGMVGFMGTEKINKLVPFGSGYEQAQARMNRFGLTEFEQREMKRLGVPKAEWQEQTAVREGVYGLGRTVNLYTAANTPNIMRHPFGRLFYQLMRFPLQLNGEVMNSLQEMGARPQKAIRYVIAASLLAEAGALVGIDFNMMLGTPTKDVGQAPLELLTGLEGGLGAMAPSLLGERSEEEMIAAAEAGEEPTPRRHLWEKGLGELVGDFPLPYGARFDLPPMLRMGANLAQGMADAMRGDDNPFAEIAYQSKMAEDKVWHQWFPGWKTAALLSQGLRIPPLITTEDGIEIPLISGPGTPYMMRPIEGEEGRFEMVDRFGDTRYTLEGADTWRRLVGLPMSTTEALDQMARSRTADFGYRRTRDKAYQELQDLEERWRETGDSKYKDQFLQVQMENRIRFQDYERLKEAANLTGFERSLRYKGTEERVKTLFDAWQTKQISLDDMRGMLMRNFAREGLLMLDADGRRMYSILMDRAFSR